MQKILKAVIPVAGLGIRFLPATKSQPKEMLPIVDKPVIQHIVEEAVCSGIKNIILITRKDKQAIANHFDVAYELEDVLTRRGKTIELEEIRSITKLGHFVYVRQGKPMGLGHAVLCAQDVINGEPFALLLGDEVFDDNDPAIAILLKAFKATGKSVIGVQEVPTTHVSRYGIVNCSKSEASPWWEVHKIVEKPTPDEAPSNWAAVGRYVLTNDIFDYLKKIKPGTGGEYQLTDALAMMANNGQLMAASIPIRRYNTGDKLDYLKANVELGLKRKDIGGALASYIKELAKKL